MSFIGSEPLLLHGPFKGGAFIAEFKADPDSDIDEDPVSVSSESEGEESTDDDDEINIPTDAGGWWRACTDPEDNPFSGPSGLLVDMKDTTPENYLNLMINNEMTDHIVAETNRYAHDCLNGAELAPKSRFHHWVDTTLGEMWAFLGLVIAMGLIKLEDLDEYWSTHAVFDLPLFRAVMTRERFTLILSFLHICNNHDRPSCDESNFDPLHKIRPFVSALKDNFQRVFAPGKNIAIDNIRIPWTGPLSFRDDRCCKTGIKVFALCDSATGYCSSFELDTGHQECSTHGAKFDVVNRLIAPFLDCGRVVFTGKDLTSPDLYAYLKQRNTLACGAMGIHRKSFPSNEMLSTLTKTDKTVEVLTNGTSNLLHFHGKPELNILTTAHKDTVVPIGKVSKATKEPIMKPIATQEYNKHIAAVVRSDKMLACNAFRRRTLKWWKKGFFHLYMLGVLNAYLVQRSQATKKLCHRTFRRDLVAQLVQWVPIPKSLSANTNRLSGVGDSQLLRLTGRHFISTIVAKPGQKVRTPQRGCVVCSIPGRRLSSRYECTSCGVGLHVAPCFEIYHTRKDFKKASKRKREESQEWSSQGPSSP